MGLRHRCILGGFEACPDYVGAGKGQFVLRLHGRNLLLKMLSQNNTKEDGLQGII